MQAININGINLYYRFAGRATGTTVVFVNSLGADWRVWEPVGERLVDRHRLLFYDKRGHGLSDVQPAPSCIADHVSDLSRLLDELDISRAVLCGLSVGGMIALGLASGRPGIVDALVLADTGHRIGSTEQWNERIAGIRQRGMEGIADGLLQIWFTASFRSHRPSETQLWRNMLVRMPAEGYVATCGAIRDADLTPAARELTVPALCLCGTADTSTPPSLVRALSALIPDSRYHDVADAAHLSTVEAPDTIATLIADYLEQRGLA